MSPPRSLGDLYQFLCATGWLSEYIFNHARLVKELREFVDDTFEKQHAHKKGRRRKKLTNGNPAAAPKTMKAADRISLDNTDWSDTLLGQWEDLRLAVLKGTASATRWNTDLEQDQ